MTPEMWVAAAALVGSVVAAVFSARSSSRATAVEASKVDAAAYDRAKGLYESALNTLEEELERVRSRLEKVTQQLAKEQDTSFAMRQQIREFRTQVETLERTVADLRVQLSQAGIPLPEGPEHGD